MLLASYWKVKLSAKTWAAGGHFCVLSKLSILGRLADSDIIMPLIIVIMAKTEIIFVINEKKVKNYCFSSWERQKQTDIFPTYDYY